MLMNECCTIYLKNKHGSFDGFDRYFIPKCHWQESEASNVLKSGLQNADGITVYVLKKDISAELETALRARKKAAQDIIIKGECNFTFDNSTQQKVSESLRALNADNDTHTIMSIDRLLYGSEDLQHYKFSAR